MKEEWRDYIHSDSRIQAGKPVVKGTRLTVDFISGLFAAVWNDKQILESYPTLSVWLYWLEPSLAHKGV